ncbi:MAG: radical SAM protein [Elusimicrobiales bacterium]|jgi:radical SAM superfamily enzyme YgiQ (UPF0313 family)
MPVKILFIDAKDLTRPIETIFAPLGLGYLVSSLRKKFGAEAVECRIVAGAPEDELAGFRPDLVGISAVSQNYGRAIAAAAAAKKFGIPVVCGGVHISMLPNSLDENMDLGVMGEGEETFCELFGLFQRTGGFQKEELAGIKGIAFRAADGRLVLTEPRAPAAPLDKIPFPARDLLETRADAHMFTSRGCPFRCVFCASSRFWSGVRLFSAEYMAAEIENLVTRYGVTGINFQDDLFTCDLERIRRVKELLLRRGVLGKVRFSGAIRAELVNDETIALLKEFGVETLGLGLESGNDRTLKYLKGPGASVAHNENAVAIIKKYGISVFGSFIIGAPQEERKEILDTLEFVKRNGVDSFGLYVLTPFPGTPVWEYAERRGLVSDDMDWSALNVDFEANSASAIILSEKLTRKEIKALFLRFKHYTERRRFYYLLKKGLTEPWKIPGYLMNKAGIRLAARRSRAEKNRHL